MLPGDVVGVFIVPPSYAALEVRLRNRASDSQDEIARRMAAARSEMAHWAEFDYLVINRDLDTAVADVRGILQAARCSIARQPSLPAFVASLMGPG